MIPGAILCALFLLMPYGGWIPALICAFAGALFAPATAYPGVVLPQAAQPEDEPAG